MMKKSSINMNFTGPFAALCKLFISQKRALGFQYESGYWLLRAFDNFCKQHTIHNCELTKEIAQAWSVRLPNESEVYRTARINEVRKFAHFLAQQGYKSYMPPVIPVVHSQHTPYIFTHNEIHQLFNCLENMPISFHSPLKHSVFPLLYKMLYGCGLRISEALHLQLQDIDTKDGTIHIRKGKNQNERKVPMACSLTKLCDQFINTHHPKEDPLSPFFFNKNRKSYTVSNIEKHFRDLLWASGISYRGKKLGPRLHDIRHTFVCHRLKQWATEEDDLLVLLPILSKYIGHSSMRATEWYLRLTTEAYPEIMIKMEAITGHIFPEVWEELL